MDPLQNHHYQANGGTLKCLEQQLPPSLTIKETDQKVSVLKT